MKEDLFNQLKEEIHSKCIAYEYCDQEDHSVSDFIASLVQVGKTEAEVNTELQSLVGSDYESNLTQWVFSRKAQMESEETAPAVKNEQPKRENRMFTQALDGIGNGRTRQRRSRSRSRSRSPVRKETRTSHREDTVFSRLGQANTESKNNEDRPSVFDRLGKKSLPVSMDKDEPKQQRCKYWPTCNNGDNCSYFHPNQICPDFPNCPNSSSECMFIHPETSKPMNIAPQPVPQPTKFPIPCRFFPYCSNPVCPYIHPVQNPYFMQSKPSYIPHNTSTQRMPVPCKNGDDCNRQDCHFLHPKDPNPYADVLCRFDGACTRPNCLYKHTQENAQNKTLTRNERTFSHPDEEVERMVVGPSADIIKGSKVEEPEEEEIGDVVVDTA
ncbi:hypothetical protein K501DRAFT_222718 [Backusella circina FSU 941]|nr:hypothetical protein K501DRAFT_222718 [Backusella circina FSU 941]